MRFALAVALLFGLLLSGRFDTGEARSDAHGPLRALRTTTTVGAGRTAVALLIAGVGLLNAASAPWAHGIGVTALLAAVVLGFVAIVPVTLTEDPGEP